MALLLPLRDGRGSRRTAQDKALGVQRAVFGTHLIEIAHTIARKVGGVFATPMHIEDATEVLVERSFAAELGQLVPTEGPAAIEAVALVEVTDESSQTSGATGPVVVRPAGGAYERAVPLTRTPLRHMACAITWPSLIDLPAESTSRSERHALLKRLDHESCPILEAVLLAAYAEEDADGRALALRSLLRQHCAGARDVFVDALRVGSDDERSFAVDALVAIGDRDALPPALCDRVEAIAARAAFGYVGSYSRADYAAALDPFVDRARVEAILTLLAGVVQ